MSAAVNQTQLTTRTVEPLLDRRTNSDYATRSNAERNVDEANFVPLSAPASGSIRQENGRHIRLFGVDIFDTTIDDAAEWLVHRASLALPTTVAFINAHCVNVMFKDIAYRNAIERCDRLFADGSGTRIAARTVGIRLSDNVNGTDLFPALCAAAAKAGTSIYLLGGHDGVSERTARRMMRQYPDLTIVGSDSGYFTDTDDEQRTIKAVNASGAQIVLVGMGVPRQELWIAKYRSQLQAPVLVGVGGLFDYYSGRLPRAPHAVRKVGLEWAWRLALEPRRLARRYLLGNVLFLARLAWLHLLFPDNFDQNRSVQKH